MQEFYHQLRALFKRKRAAQKPTIAELPAAILEQIARESNYLRNQHAVEVHALPDNFEARKPHAADPEVEATLPVMAQDT